jgi:hypothetical protein
MRIWRCNKRGLADAAGDLTLLCEKVGRDEQLVVEQIIAVDETTLGAEIEIGIQDSEIDWPVAEQVDAAANEKYFKAVTMRLNPYEQVYCHFSGATENDVCHFWSYGVIVMRDESYLKPEHHTGR